MLISIETLITCAFPGEGCVTPPLGPQMRLSGGVFVCFDSLHPINNLSDIKWRFFWVEPVLS